MYKINTKTLPNCFDDFLQISPKTHHNPTQFATGNNYSLFFFNKTNSQRPFAMKVLSFGMSYQMNLQIRLIKADMLS